ncbi:MAG: response regulator [Deltaproteobacteria bacterium]|nr:response regulator [Deltaproteobacteria bacterium]
MKANISHKLVLAMAMPLVVIIILAYYLITLFMAENKMATNMDRNVDLFLATVELLNVLQTKQEQGFSPRSAQDGSGQGTGDHTAIQLKLDSFNAMLNLSSLAPPAKENFLTATSRFNSDLSKMNDLDYERFAQAIFSVQGGIVLSPTTRGIGKHFLSQHLLSDAQNHFLALAGEIFTAWTLPHDRIKEPDLLKITELHSSVEGVLKSPAMVLSSEGTMRLRYLLTSPFIAFENQVISAFLSSKLSAATVGSAEDFRRQANDFRDRLAVLQQQELLHIKNFTTNYARETTHRLWALISAIVLLLGVPILTFYFLYRWVSRPINNLALFMSEVGQGRKPPDPVIRQNDEIGQLSSALTKMVQDLRRVEAHNRLILDSVGEGIIGLDSELKQVFVNPEAERLLGYGLNELIGRTSHDIWHHTRVDGRPYPLEDCPIHYTLVTGEIQQVDDEVFWRKDGSSFPVEYIVTPLKEGDALIGTVIIFRDMTESRQIEDERLQALNRAEEASRVKSNFLAIMSHEIRTPMYAILGVTELALEDPLEPEIKDQFEIVRDSAETLLALLDDILDFAKIEMDKLELEIINFDLRQLVESLVRTMIVLAQAKGLELKAHISPQVPAVLKGDPVRLKQILVNLTGNAIKFTHSGSVILNIEPANPVAAGPEVMEPHPDVRLQFSVKDTGVGVPSENLNSIFDYFSQGDSSITRRYGGTGLGLAICRRLVHLMGGDIWLESRPDSGSTFYFTAVFQPREPADLNALETVFTSPMQTPLFRILLVDDHPVNLKVGKRYLTKRGHSVAVAANGLEALERLKERRFDIVLMDLEMPEMDGIEATHRIREGQGGAAAREIPIIAMTAHALTGFKEKCLAAGMNDFLTKPVDFQHLEKIFAQYHPGEIIMPVLPEQTSSIDQGSVVLERSRTLGRMGNDEELLKTLYETFLEDLPDQKDRLRQAIDQDRLEDIKAYAHSLKGVLAIIGAEICRDLAIKLEQAAKSAHHDEIRRHWRELEHGLETARETMSRFM